MILPDEVMCCTLSATHASAIQQNPITKAFKIQRAAACYVNQCLTHIKAADAFMLNCLGAQLTWQADIAAASPSCQYVLPCFRMSIMKMTSRISASHLSSS